MREAQQPLAERLRPLGFSCETISSGPDDFRVTNPASNPELLDALAKDFIDSKFDNLGMNFAVLGSDTFTTSGVTSLDRKSVV